MFVISLCLARSVGYDINSVRLTDDVIPSIFVKQPDAKPKRISSLASWLPLHCVHVLQPIMQRSLDPFGQL